MTKRAQQEGWLAFSCRTNCGIPSCVPHYRYKSQATRVHKSCIMLIKPDCSCNCVFARAKITHAHTSTHCEIQSSMPGRTGNLPTRSLHSHNILVFCANQNCGASDVTTASSSLPSE